MKKLFLRSLLLISMIGFNSCQKEIMDKASGGKEKNTARIENTTALAPDDSVLKFIAPLSYFVNKRVDAPGCYNGHGCSIASYPAIKRARLHWDVDYPHPGKIHYVLYRKTGSSGGYNQYIKADTFNCNTTSGMWYAGNALAYNNTTYIITLSIGTNGSPISNAPSSIKEDGNGNLYTSGGTGLAYIYGYTDTWKFTTGSASGQCRFAQFDTTRG